MRSLPGSMTASSWLAPPQRRKFLRKATSTRWSSFGRPILFTTTTATTTITATTQRGLCIEAFASILAHLQSLICFFQEVVVYRIVLPIEFAASFNTFEEHICFSSSVRQVVPPESCCQVTSPGELLRGASRICCLFIHVYCTCCLLYAYCLFNCMVLYVSLCCVYVFLLCRGASRISTPAREKIT